MWRTTSQVSSTMIRSTTSCKTLRLMSKGGDKCLLNAGAEVVQTLQQADFLLTLLALALDLVQARAASARGPQPDDGGRSAREAR